MPWPTLQEYNEAIQNPNLAFSDLALRNGQAELNIIGLPRPIAGNFACVYKIQNGGQSWAARCFSTEISDQKRRYEAISLYLARVSLPYTIPFTFLPAGIRVQGKQYPILKMQWVQGEPLHAFIRRSIADSETLISVARYWLKMMEDLKTANIAHGDLQHGNILVVGQQICLIDYDGMYVPALAGSQSNELGHRNYQLPSRSQWDFGPYLDNFSAWVIYVSLIALAVHPELWNAHNGGDECLIFRKDDFVNPSGSALLRDLNSSPNDELRLLVELFSNFFSLSPQDVPSLDGKLPDIKIERPKPWWSDFARGSSEPRDVQCTATDLSTDGESAVPDPGWIIDSLVESKPVEAVHFQSNPKELRIIAIGSLAMVFVITLLAGLPVSEVIFTTFSVFGLNLLLCFVRYQRDPCHIDFDIFKKEAKNFVREVRENQTLIDSIAAERVALEEKQTKIEREIVKQRNRVSADLQAELAKLQVDLNSRLQSINQRRQATKVEETKKLNSLQETLGNQIKALDQRIFLLDRAEADEKNKAAKDLQDNHIQSRLRSHFLAHSSISGIGTAYKNRLLAAGIVTAADLDWRVSRISGIGPTRQAALLTWRNFLEAEARQSAPGLSASDRRAIEDKYRIERQTHERAKSPLQNDLNAKIADARQYFVGIIQSLNQEDRQIRGTNEYEKNQVQEQYSTQFTAIDADLNRSKSQAAPKINELTDKLRAAQKQVFALRWKSEKHKKEGRRFASLRFRDYLHKIVSS